jgi:hypothetical protein
MGGERICPTTFLSFLEGLRARGILDFSGDEVARLETADSGIPLGLTC